MNIKDQIHSSLSWQSICRHYQIEYRENKNISCPFDAHQDQKPSFSFFGADKFKCHSCGISGDFFEFIAQKENLDCNKDFSKVLEVAERISGMMQQGDKSSQKKLDQTRNKDQTLQKPTSTITNDDIEKYHKQLLNSPKIIQYLEDRGIFRDILEEFKIGFGSCKEAKGSTKIFIPYFDTSGDPLFFRFRAWKEDDPVKIFAKSGTELCPYLLQNVEGIDEVFITEGEIDTLTLLSNGICAIGMPSATTFKEEWIGYFKNIKKVTICFDNDEGGRSGTKRIIEVLQEHLPEIEIYQIKWPENFPEKGDVNDFFVKSEWHAEKNEIDAFMCLRKIISPKNPVQDIIHKYLNTPTHKPVFLSDVIKDDLFFHTFPIEKDCSLVLLFNGEHLCVGLDKEKNASFFEYQDRRYDFRLPIFLPSPEINRPNKEGLKLFLNQPSLGKNIYFELCELLTEFYDFFCKEEIHLVATNIVHSYFINAIGRTFYMLLDGEAGTGKSSLQTLLSYLQFNGSFSGKTSMLAMVRNIHFFQTSQNIDELDKLDKDDKKNAIGVLNTGFLKNGAYVIVNMGKKKVEEQEQRFHTFGTKSFSVNKVKFDDSLLSRCIIIHTVRNKRNVKNIFSLSFEDELRFQEMRNKLFVYSLFHWKDFHEIIAKNKRNFEEKEMYGRPSDVYSIICGISEYFSGNTDLRDYLVRKGGFEKDSNKYEDRFYYVLKFIAESFSNTKEDYLVLNATHIGNYITEQMDITDDRYKPTPQSIGRMLKSNRVVDENTKYEMCSTGSDRGKRVWLPKKMQLEDLIKRSSFPELKDLLPPKKCYNATNPQEPLL